MAYLSLQKDWQARHQPGYAASSIHAVTNFCGLLSPSFARHGPMSLVVSHESEVLNGRILKYKTGMSDIGVNSQGA
jgi:hypothetical protein